MSIYQRQHYEDVAHVIKVRGRVDRGKGLPAHYRAIARDFASLFATDNPPFDREWFLKACEGAARRIR